MFEYPSGCKHCMDIIQLPKIKTYIKLKILTQCHRMYIICKNIQISWKMFWKNSNECGILKYLQNIKDGF